MAGVEYQVTKVDPTDPETKGMVYQVHKVSEEVAATLGGKVYRARIIKDPSDPAVAGKVYQIVLIGDPSAPAVKGKVYNAILTGGSEAVVVGPAVSPLALDDAVADTLTYVKAFGGTEQRNLPAEYTELEYIQADGTQYINSGIVPTSFDYDIETVFAFDSVNSGNTPLCAWGYMGSGTYPRWLLASYQGRYLLNANTTTAFDSQDISKHTFLGKVYLGENNAPRWSATVDGTTLLDDQVLPSDTTFTSNTLSIYLFARNNSNEAGNFVSGKMYRHIVTKAGVVIQNLLPAKRKSDNVVGLYDTVSGTFFTNAGTGTFAAGGEAVPTPDTPMDIVSNNGVLKVRHQSGLPLDYTLLDYVETDGNSYIDTNLLLSNTSEFEITFQSADATLNTPVMGAISGGTSFTSTDNLCVTYNVTSGLNAYSVYCNGAAGVANESWNAGDAQDKLKHTVKYNGLNIAPTLDGVDMEQLVPTTLTTNTPTVTTWLFGRNNTGSGTKTQTGVRIYDFKVDGVAHFVPCKNASNVVGMYDTVNGVFYQNAGTGTFTAGDPVSDPVEVYADGLQETIAIKDDQSATVSSAVAEMLLKVGDYQDEQEVISGAITRNVGIKVLDGTEDIYNGSAGYWGIEASYFPDIKMQSPMVWSNCWTQGAYISPTGAYCSIAGLTYFAFNKGSLPNASTTTDVKQWLSDQYAAGTPVIVIYPLATPTTESVTGQTLQVTDGDNTLEITQASLTGLELEAEYEKEGA